MHAISAVPDKSIELPGRPGERTTAEQQVAERADEAAAAELMRWTIFLGVPFLASAAFFAAAIGTGQAWLISGALVTGPGLLIFAFIYLGLTSDTNGVQ